MRWEPSVRGSRTWQGEERKNPLGLGGCLAPPRHALQTTSGVGREKRPRLPRGSRKGPPGGCSDVWQAGQTMGLQRPEEGARARIRRGAPHSPQPHREGGARPVPLCWGEPRVTRRPRDPPQIGAAAAAEEEKEAGGRPGLGLGALQGAWMARWGPGSRGGRGDGRGSAEATPSRAKGGGAPGRPGGRGGGGGGGSRAPPGGCPGPGSHNARGPAGSKMAQAIFEALEGERGGCSARRPLPPRPRSAGPGGRAARREQPRGGRGAGAGTARGRLGRAGLRRGGRGAAGREQRRREGARWPEQPREAQGEGAGPWGGVPRQARAGDRSQPSGPAGWWWSWRAAKGSWGAGRAWTSRWGERDDWCHLGCKLQAQPQILEGWMGCPMSMHDPGMGTPTGAKGNVGFRDSK